MKENIVNWLRRWFEINGKDCNAVIGISGGKDSSVVAALCVEALGKDRVIGVLMPDGEQKDISDSYKLVNYLGIKHYTIDISKCKNALYDSIQSAIGNALIDNTGNNFEITEQTKFNLPPRIRMATLYAISQSNNGRVLNTCNLSETLLGWETRWGDAVGDVAPLANLTVTEVKQLGYELGLPKELVDKIPADGLCGSSDEEKMGIKYSDMDKYIRTGICDKEVKEKIDKRIRENLFKHSPIPSYDPSLNVMVL